MHRFVSKAKPKASSRSFYLFTSNANFSLLSFEIIVWMNRKLRKSPSLKNFFLWLIAVLPELFFPKSPIWVDNIAKFATYFGQNRGIIASFWAINSKNLTPPIHFYSIFMHQYFSKSKKFRKNYFFVKK